MQNYSFHPIPPPSSPPPTPLPVRVSLGSLRHLLPEMTGKAKPERKRLIEEALRAQTGKLPRHLSRQLARLTRKLGTMGPDTPPGALEKLNRDLGRLADTIEALPNKEALFA